MELRQLFLKSLELLFPRVCLICKRPLAQTSLCFRCLPLNAPELLKIETARRLPFVSVGTLWNYEGNAQEFVAAMKYGPSLRLARLAGEFLTTQRESVLLFPADVIIPVPSSRRTFQRRLFNQSAVLAQELSRSWEVPLCIRGLWHTGYRRTQASLREDARFHNVKEAFKARAEYVAGQNVVLVDDVITTGATISAASQTLLGCGAATIQVVALARNASWVQFQSRLAKEFSPPVSKRRQDAP